MMEELLRRVRRALPAGFLRRIPRTVKMIAVSEKESRRLNRKYRKKDYPANVLSFHYGPEYGEIIICPALIRRQARKVRQSYDCRMTWMVLHGTLHLGGFHHEDSKVAAKRFERVEQSILKRSKNQESRIKGKRTTSHP